MKTKLKDFLLYLMACVGAVSLFLSAYQPQQTTSNIPESHVWELKIAESNAHANGGRAYLYNKVTGEVRKYNRAQPSDRKAQQYLVMRELKIN